MACERNELGAGPLHDTKLAFDRFVLLSGSDNFILFLPKEGEELNRFLDSCFHKEFVWHVYSKYGYQARAVFAEHRPEGKASIFFSVNSDFNITHARRLQHVAAPFSKGKAGCESKASACFIVGHDIMLRYDFSADPPKDKIEETGKENRGEVLQQRSHGTLPGNLRKCQYCSGDHYDRQCQVHRIKQATQAFQFPIVSALVKRLHDNIMRGELKGNTQSKHYCAGGDHCIDSKGIHQAGDFFKPVWKGPICCNNTVKELSPYYIATLHPQLFLGDEKRTSSTSSTKPLADPSEFKNSRGSTILDPGLGDTVVDSDSLNPVFSYETALARLDNMSGIVDSLTKNIELCIVKAEEIGEIARDGADKDSEVKDGKGPEGESLDKIKNETQDLSEMTPGPEDSVESKPSGSGKKRRNKANRQRKRQAMAKARAESKAKADEDGPDEGSPEGISS